MSDANQVTRRGFLSFVVGLAAVSTIPALAEPAKVLQAAALPAPLRSGLVHGLRLERYALALMPDANGLIEPGRVTILRARPQRIIRPERLVFSEPGFSLLHLAATGEPLLEDEVPSDWFAPSSFETRLEFAPLEVGEEIVVAAVNRNRDARQLAGMIISSAISESNEPLPVYMPGRDFDDDDDDEPVSE